MYWLWSMFCKLVLRLAAVVSSPIWLPFFLVYWIRKKTAAIPLRSEEEFRQEAREANRQADEMAKALEAANQHSASLGGDLEAAQTKATVAQAKLLEALRKAGLDERDVPICLVEGGTMDDETLKRVESYLNETRKGRGDFHKILVLEGEQGIKIELLPSPGQTCPTGQAIMVPRTHRKTGESFWGCGRFESTGCRGTRETIDVSGVTEKCGCGGVGLVAEQIRRGKLERLPVRIEMFNDALKVVVGEGREMRTHFEPFPTSHPGASVVPQKVINDAKRNAEANWEGLRQTGDGRPLLRRCAGCASVGGLRPEVPDLAMKGGDPPWWKGKDQAVGWGNPKPPEKVFVGLGMAKATGCSSIALGSSTKAVPDKSGLGGVTFTSKAVDAGKMVARSGDQIKGAITKADLDLSDAIQRQVRSPGFLSAQQSPAAAAQTERDRADLARNLRRY